MPIRCNKCGERLPSYAYLTKIYTCTKCKEKEKTEDTNNSMPPWFEALFWWAFNKSNYS